MMVCAISNTDWTVTPLGRMEVLETLRSKPVSSLKTVLSSVRTCITTINLALMYPYKTYI